MARRSVVLDTNIVVSAHLNPDGLERYVLDLALAERITLFVSPAILVEYAATLSRPKFGLSTEEIADSLRLIRAVARNLTPTVALAVCSDPDDDKFVECAHEADADYLVTGNKRHFPKRWKRTLVVNAREFFSAIAAEL